MRRFVRLVVAGAILLVAVPAVAGGAAADATLGEDPGARNSDPECQLDTTLSGRAYSIQNVVPSPEVHGTAEQLSLETVDFLVPLHDDGAPYSLRPFLQRTSTVSFSIGGGHFATHNPFGGPDRTELSGGASGAVNIYVRRWLALTGGLAYDYYVLHDVGVDQSTHAYSGSAGLGFRTGDMRIDASYGLVADDISGSFAPLRQSFQLSAEAAIARRWLVSLSGTVIAGGQEGTISPEYFLTRDIGLFASAFAGKGKFYSEDLVVKRYGGSGGLACWVDHDLELVAEYQLTIEDLPAQLVTPDSIVGYHEVSHTIFLGVNLRLP